MASTLICTTIILGLLLGHNVDFIVGRPAHKFRHMAFRTRCCFVDLFCARACFLLGGSNSQSKRKRRSLLKAMSAIRDLKLRGLLQSLHHSLTLDKTSS
ncbi:hypothetical protein BaRGS_00000266 [Batillaria attramentaria]|uniref:Secreted protein n=1 Tax=Batillaria attramentaria TaxID=370345 RepID=A0ABD0M9W7_9CAEN